MLFIEYIWSQEEPVNKGPWTFVQPRITNLLGHKVHCIRFCTYIWLCTYFTQCSTNL